MTTSRRAELIPEILAVAGEFLRESERLFRPHGATAAQYNVLAALASQADGISQRELSDLLVVDRSNVTGLLNRMEREGWVKRQDDPRDRRAYRVVLTDEGRRLAALLGRLYDAAVTNVTAGLSENQARQTVMVLQRLKQQAAAWRA